MALAFDSSTPALFTNDTAVSSGTSNSFSPPAGSLLVCTTGCPFSSGITVSSITDSLGSHLNWTKLIQAQHNADAEIWAADCPSAQTGMTVTVNYSTATARPAVGVLVMTGAGNVAAQVANNNVGSSTSSPPSITTPNACQAGSYCIMVASNWSSSAAPTIPAGQTDVFNGNTYYFNESVNGTGWYAQTTTSANAGGSAVTLNDTAPTGTTLQSVIAEIVAAAGGGGATGPTFIPHRMPLGV